MIGARLDRVRLRLNTLFMGAMFLGGATGSALAMIARSAGGWSLVSALGIAFALAAVPLQLRRNHSIS